MRELALTGLIAIAFGLGSFYATEQFGAFSAVNLVGGCLVLAVAAVAGARRLRFAGGPHSRRVMVRGALLISSALVLAVALERAAFHSHVQFDWTGEQRFELSEATRKALAELPGPITLTLYRDEFDPRSRRTRLLLEELARASDGKATTRERLLDENSEEEDLYEVGSSNTVVLALGDRFETVGRPTEGTLYEALYRMRSVQAGVITLLRGEGEGDIENEGDLGYSGLAAALQTEGYRLRSVVTAALDEIPEETDAVLMLAPRRRLRETALDALRRYLEGGGRLVALLEPGVESGVEGLLAEYGLTSLDGVIVDPASGDVGTGASEVNIVAYNYTHHPATRGLDRNRMTFFTGARSFSLRKPRPEDEIKTVVFSSPYAWLSEDLSLLERRAPGRLERNGAPQDYQPIVVVGRYRRDRGEARIVAVGDSDFASNRWLRALYNLDIALNSLHWAVQREAEITLRPKIRATVQFPLPIANSLRTLYGVGLLFPELLLIAGAVVWLRRRSA